MLGVSAPVDLEACSIGRGVSRLALLRQGQQRVVAGTDAQGIGRVNGGWIEGRV